MIDFNDEFKQFEKSIRQRNIRETLAAIFIIVLIAIDLITNERVHYSSQFFRIALILSAIYVLLWVNIKGKMKNSINSLSSDQIIETLSYEIQNQIKFLKGVPINYIFPLAFGVYGLLASLFLNSNKHWILILTFVVVFIFETWIFCYVYKNNKKGAEIYLPELLRRVESGD